MNRRQDIELLRIISAFGVVWFHSGAMGSEIAYAGLVNFLILSVYLGGLNIADDLKTLARRFKRLLVPWLVWFAVYASINIITGKPTVPTGNGIVAGILAGPSIHLWYMPFIFVCLNIHSFFRRYVSGPLLAYACAILAAVVLVSTSIWRIETLNLGAPFSQYMHALAGVLLGVYFIHFHELTNRLLLLYILVIASIVATSCPGVGIPYLLGIFSCYIVLCYKKKDFFMQVQQISQHMFGVYLIHPLFMRIFSHVSFMNKYTVLIITFMFSILTVVILKYFFPRISKYCF